MVDDAAKLVPGRWVSLYDSEEGGEIVDVESDAVTYWDRGKQRAFTVPRAVCLPAEHPDVERAAFEILDILCEFDPRWRQNDTCAIRERVVLKVLQLARPDHAAVTGQVGHG